MPAWFLLLQEIAAAARNETVISPIIIVSIHLSSSLAAAACGHRAILDIGYSHNITHMPYPTAPCPVYITRHCGVHHI
jgi:deoxycytidine triphosphate deaminase